MENEVLLRKFSILNSQFSIKNAKPSDKQKGREGGSLPAFFMRGYECLCSYSSK